MRRDSPSLEIKMSPFLVTYISVPNWFRASTTSFSSGFLSEEVITAYLGWIKVKNSVLFHYIDHDGVPSKGMLQIS